MNDDLISRAAAIDAINKAFERVFAWDGTSPLGDKVLENVPSAQPEQRWIPVTERCPEIGQIVLCLLKTRHYYGRIHVCKYCAADKYYDHPYFDWGHNGFPDVVAWMPLPEPYREDEE